MPRYVGLFTYTGEAWDRMVREPANRADAARQTIEDAGGQMEAFYWMFGEHDGLVIFTMPSAAAAAAYSAAVASSGRVRSHVTYQTLDMDEATEALQLAKRVRRSYRPPGGGEDWRAEYDALGSSEGGA
jgi:uncharacterized protein with GYD domain